MTIEKLIKRLEHARELATHGDAEVMTHPNSVDAALRIGGFMSVPCMLGVDADAIAIRHDTADEVLGFLNEIQKLITNGKSALDNTKRAIEVADVLRSEIATSEIEIQELKAELRQCSNHDGRRNMNEAPKDGEEIRIVREGVFRKAVGLGNEIVYWQSMSEGKEAIVSTEVQPRIWRGDEGTPAICWWYSNEGRWVRMTKLYSSNVFVSGLEPKPTIDPGRMNMKQCEQVDW